MCCVLKTGIDPGSVFQVFKFIEVNHRNQYKPKTLVWWEESGGGVSLDSDEFLFSRMSLKLQFDSAADGRLANGSLSFTAFSSPTGRQW